MPTRNIKKRISEIKSQMESNLPLINGEIEGVIKNKDKSVERIEYLLDTLLDYVALGLGEEEFKRLNVYYASFNPKNAEIYVHLYNEMNER